MTTVLITGATGFLGAHMAAGALAAGWSVRAGVRARSDRGRLNRLAPGADPVELDLGSADRIGQVLRGVDVVLHCAAYGVDYRQSDFHIALDTNVTASMRLAEQANLAGIRMIHVGTAYEYGAEDGLLDEDRRLDPTGIYGVTKAAATLAVRDLARRTGAPIVVVRPFGMYGPWEGSHKFVPMVMAASLTGQPVELTPGHQERDYLYVGDVVDACLALAVRTPFPAGALLNICSGQGLSLRDLAGAAVAAIGGDPAVLRWGAKDYRAAESMRVVGTGDRLRTLVDGFATTGLVDGMARTAAAERLRIAAIPQ